MSAPIEGMPREADFADPTPTFADFDPEHPTPAQVSEFASAFTSMRRLQTEIFGEKLDATVFIRDYANKPQEASGDEPPSSVEQGLSA